MPEQPREASVDRHFCIEFPSNPLYLTAVRQFVSRLCSVAGFEQKECYAITLAVDEACTNIIKHSYELDTSRRIEMSADLLPEGGIQFRLTDYGRECDPKALGEFQYDNQKPGGLGLFLMNRIMDRVEFDASEGGCTRLRLVKYLATG